MEESAAIKREYRCLKTEQVLESNRWSNIEDHPDFNVFISMITLDAWVSYNRRITAAVYSQLGLYQPTQ